MARVQAKLAKLQVSSFFQLATITHSASAELFSYVELNSPLGWYGRTLANGATSIRNGRYVGQSGTAGSKRVPT
jgi:hypothetical protein